MSTTDITPVTETSTFPTPEQIAAYQRREHERLDAEIAEGKQAVLTRARHHGVTHLIVSYDGEGDEGQIESIAAFRVPNGSQPDDDTSVDPAGLFENAQAQGHSLADIAENLALSILGRHHDDFEINSGAFGELHIDVAKETFSLAHNIRVMDSINETSEV